jgi:HK97 family phage portal protein
MQNAKGKFRRLFEAIGNLLTPRASDPQGRLPADPILYGPTPQLATAGIRVNDQAALGVASFYACVRLLSQTLASFPLLLYRRLPDGGKERAADLPLFAMLHRRPNRWQTTYEWLEMLVVHVCLRGNFYNRILVDPTSRDPYPIGVLPLHPDRVTVDQLADGSLRYVHRPPNRPPQIYLRDEILHVRGLSLDGVTGLNPVAAMRNALGLSIAQETHGSKLFANGSLPPFALESPSRMNPQAIENFRKGWRTMHAGAENAHNPPILENGMKIHELALNNEDSQWLQSREWQGFEVARFMGVPPNLIGLKFDARVSSIEQQSIGFATYTMGAGWCARAEQRIAADLLPEDADLFVEFLIDALLRGDLKSRYEAYNVGIQGGFLTRNEVRIKENMNPLPGLDKPLQPLNMAPAGQKPGNAGQGTGAGGQGTGDGEQGTGDRNAALAADAARRIARRESQAIGRRIGHAAEDPDRFAKWFAEWSAGHVDFARNVLATLVGETASAELAVNLVGGLRELLLTVASYGDQSAAWAHYEPTREAAIERRILETLNPEP